jgi:hypothetical protein
MKAPTMQHQCSACGIPERLRKIGRCKICGYKYCARCRQAHAKTHLLINNPDICS